MQNTTLVFSRRILISLGVNSFLLFLLASSVFISGCATAPHPTPKTPVSTTVSSGKGVYHKVAAGETIWRIAKVYGVTIDDIVKSNAIANVSHIEKNQLIFIPGADRAKSIPTEHDLKDTEFSWPIKGKILSFFGETKGLKINRGIDIAGKEGEPLTASRSGKVVFADYLSGQDYTIVLDHLDGYYSVYSQNSKLMVKLDDMVAQGAPIAKIGARRGVPYAHFEIRRKSVADNPMYYLP